MEAPVCLVENRRNRLHVSPEALRLLSEIRNSVVVVSIVGLYRRGKSYLMNKLAGKNSDAKMKAKKLEDEVQKQKEEMWQQKFEDQKQSYEMTLRKLMEKLEEERKQILEEQEKMIQRTLKEELAAFGCCCCCKKSVRGAQEEKDYGGLRRELASNPLISLERRCISFSKARMEAPVCLIENRPNGLHVSLEALQLLSEIRNPVVVVSIVGLYRTGKSYLMNRLAGKNSGFPLGSTVEAKTKGIWMWCVPHPDRPNQTLVLLDTEGLGDTEKGNSQNDIWIFSLAMLLSSTLVYNSVGTIDQTALEKLHFVTELSKHIKAKSSSATGDTDETSGFVGFSPNFVWSVRDFTLQLQQDGKSITEDEYLEHALELKEGDSKKEQEFNLPRKCIRLFFPTRKCFVFDCPTESRNLPYLEKMVDNQLEPEFVEQANKFCHHIYETSQEKTLPGGHIATGNSLAKLVETYVATISSGNIPCLENSVLSLAEIENRAAMQEVVTHYAQLMEQSLELPTETLQELLDIHKLCEEQALQMFMARAFKDDKRQFQLELMKTVESKKEEYCEKNMEISSEICSVLLDKLAEVLEENIKNGSYSRVGGHQEFLNDLQKVKEQFLETPKKGLMARKILEEFLQSKENISKTILQSDVSLQEKEREIADEKMKARANELEQEMQKQKIEMLKQTLEDLKQSQKKNLRKLRGKMEEETKKMKEEYEKRIKRKLKKTVESKKEEYCEKNKEIFSEICSVLLDKLAEVLKENIKNGNYSQADGDQDFLDVLQKAGKLCLEIPKKGLSVVQTVLNILQPFLPIMGNIIKTLFQSDESHQEKEKEIADKGVKPKAKELEQEAQKQEIEMLKQKLEDLQQKIEEETEQRKEEYEKMIESKLKLMHQHSRIMLYILTSLSEGSEENINKRSYSRADDHQEFLNDIQRVKKQLFESRKKGIMMPSGKITGLQDATSVINTYQAKKIPEEFLPIIGNINKTLSQSDESHQEKEKEIADKAIKPKAKELEQEAQKQEIEMLKQKLEDLQQKIEEESEQRKEEYEKRIESKLRLMHQHSRIMLYILTSLSEGSEENINKRSYSRADDHQEFLNDVQKVKKQLFESRKKGLMEQKASWEKYFKEETDQQKEKIHQHQKEKKSEKGSEKEFEEEFEDPINLIMDLPTLLLHLFKMMFPFLKRLLFY